VISLFKKLLGIKKINDNWNWQGMATDSANSKLRKFIETRGAIAHRGELEQSITRAYVEGHRQFIIRLSVRTANTVRSKVKQEIGTSPGQELGMEILDESNIKKRMLFVLTHTL